MTTITKIEWKKEIKDAIEIIKLNKVKMKEVSEKKTSTTVGIVFLVVPVVLNALFSWISVSGSWGGFYTYISILPIISVVIGIFIFSYIAVKFYKGTGNHEAFFRVVSYACLLLWINAAFLLLSVIGLWGITMSALMMIPGLISIWILAVTYYALMEIHHLSSENAIITMVIGVVAAIIINGILQAFYPKPSILNYDIENVRFEGWEDIF